MQRENLLKFVRIHGMAKENAVQNKASVADKFSTKKTYLEEMPLTSSSVELEWFTMRIRKMRQNIITYFFL